VILVDDAKSTLALPVCWVTWIASPDTEAIIPLTMALPFGDADGDDDDVGAEPVELAELAVVVSCEAPHAAIDSAVAPVTVSIANRVSGADVIRIPDIEGLSNRRPSNDSHHSWRG
jgi:predicted secreted protein